MRKEKVSDSSVCQQLEKKFHLEYFIKWSIGHQGDSFLFKNLFPIFLVRLLHPLEVLSINAVFGYLGYVLVLVCDQVT